MLKALLKYPCRKSQRGFTLLEAMLVVGLTTLVAAGVIVGLMEGMDVLTQVTDNWSVQHGQQRVSSVFLDDMRSAKWFYNETETGQGGGQILRQTASTVNLIIGYEDRNGDEIWVRYRARPGSFTGETYAVRTVISPNPDDTGSTILATGVANLEFSYLDENGEFTDQIPEIKRVLMTLSLNVGGATEQRVYEATLRNANGGARVPTGDFDDIESQVFVK